MNRNILYLAIAALVVIVAVLGYRYYQEQRTTTGIEINVGKDSISIQKN